MGDRAAIERTLAGDTDAFRELISRHSREVRIRAHRVLPLPHLADEAAHETFVRAYLRLDSFDPNRSFQAWLFGILHRIVGEYYRQLQRQAETEVPMEQLGETLWQLAQQRADLHEDSPYRVQLRRCLRQAPAGTRRLIQLRYADNLSSAEIGKLLGKTAFAVNTSLMRTRQSLRRCIRANLEVPA